MSISENRYQLHTGTSSTAQPPVVAPNTSRGTSASDIQKGSARVMPVSALVLMRVPRVDFRVSIRGKLLTLNLCKCRRCGVIHLAHDRGQVGGPELPVGQKVTGDRDGVGGQKCDAD